MFIPKPTPHGGSPVGNSYLSLWHRCRRKWFLQHLYPHEDATGLRSQAGTLRVIKNRLSGPGANLMLGSLLHEFREAWYRSGFKDGEDTGAYDVDAGLTAIKTYLLKRQDEFVDAEASAFALAKVADWGLRFHEHFGPGGHTPLWPTERVLALEDGTPAIELELALPLGHEDYVYTTRLDAVTLWQDRYVLGQEHKSAAPSWAQRYIEQLPKQSQFTGELWVIRTHPDLADLPWEGLQVNFHLKDWTPKSTFPSPVMSAKTSRSPQALEAWRLGAIRTLQEIDAAVAEYEAGRSQGRPLTHLMDWIFPETGERTGECFAFNSTCEFIDLCKMGIGPGTLGGFRSARPAPQEDTTSE
jgi:hypothetical protein